MLMNGRRDLADIGRYRTHVDPMQIVSGDLHAPRVHYEAPPSDSVSTEMQAFVAWFNDSAPTGTKSLTAITRAAIGHLWFESIHPFEDGNRSEENTSELQSLMRISYAVFCLQKKIKN